MFIERIVIYDLCLHIVKLYFWAQGGASDPSADNHFVCPEIIHV